MVREKAEEWNVNPHKIGIMGFSAGGHLAATAGTHFDTSFIENPKGTSLRPDFMILVYPVISMTDSLTHKGSRGYLLGEDPGPDLIRQFSNEMHVTSSTPEAFLILSGDDTVVRPENSLVFYNALVKCGVRSEMHIYREGEHGFLEKPPFSEWFGRICFWMKTCNLL
jgi:acetyl esterase/lipase